MALTGTPPDPSSSLTTTWTACFTSLFERGRGTASSQVRHTRYALCYEQKQRRNAVPASCVGSICSGHLSFYAASSAVHTLARKPGTTRRARSCPCYWLTRPRSRIPLFPCPLCPSPMHIASSSARTFLPFPALVWTPFLLALAPDRHSPMQFIFGSFFCAHHSEQEVSHGSHRWGHSSDTVKVLSALCREGDGEPGAQ